MCFTLTQHYITCSHTDVALISCDDKIWHPEHRHDGLTSEWRDHSVRKGVAHSYRRKCPSCMAAGERKVRKPTGLGAWTAFAARHQDADADENEYRGSESGSESGLEEYEVVVSDESEDGGLGWTVVGSGREEPDMETTTLENETNGRIRPVWRDVEMDEVDDNVVRQALDEVDTDATGNGQTPQEQNNNSNSFSVSLPRRRRISLVPLQPEQHVVNNNEEPTLRDLYESEIRLCLLATFAGGRITSEKAAEVLQDIMERECHSAGAIQASIFPVHAREFIFRQLRRIVNDRIHHLPTVFDEVFTSILARYRARENEASRSDQGNSATNREAIAGGDTDVDLELQVSLMAWLLQVAHHFWLARLMEQWNPDRESAQRGPFGAQRAILTTARVSFFATIGSWTRTDLIWAAEELVASDRASWELELRQRLSATESDRVIRQTPTDQESVRDPVRHLERTARCPPQSALNIGLVGAERPQTNTSEERGCSYATHHRNPHTKHCVRHRDGAALHGDNPEPCTRRDATTNVNTHNVLFHFAGCGHYNAVNVEALRFRADRQAIVAQCGCLGFPDELLMGQKALSLRSCLVCRQAFVPKYTKKPVNDEWAEFCLERQVRLVTKRREIDLWPFEM